MTTKEAIDTLEDVKAYISQKGIAYRLIVEDITTTPEQPIDAINIAIDALTDQQQDKIFCLGDSGKKCIHCTVRGETTHYCYCDMWDSVVDPHGWCNYGARG